MKSENDAICENSLSKEIQLSNCLTPCYPPSVLFLVVPLHHSTLRYDVEC